MGIEFALGGETDTGRGLAFVELRSTGYADRHTFRAAGGQLLQPLAITRAVGKHKTDLGSLTARVLELGIEHGDRV